MAGAEGVRQETSGGRSIAKQVRQGLTVECLAAACVMRVHVVMRCGHVQEWPPGRGCMPGWGCLGSCGFALWRAWLVSEAPTSKPPKPVPVFDGYESTVQQTVSASWLSAINEPAMSTSGLPAALGEGAAR